MTIYYNLYKRMIQRKNGTCESILASIEAAFSKGMLTQEEYDELIEMLNKAFEKQPTEEQPTE